MGKLPPPPPSPLKPPSNIIQKDIGVIKTSAEIPNVPPPLSSSLNPRENIRGEGYISAGVFSMFDFSHTAVRKGGGRGELVSYHLSVFTHWMFGKLPEECTSYLFCFHSYFELICVCVCGVGRGGLNILTTISFVFNHSHCIHCFSLSGGGLDLLARTLGKSDE